jgi:uncharacterized protein YrzB (UPF0473 family)
MSNDYGGTFITLIGEDGEEVVLEYLDTVEYEGKIYMAFFPTLDEDTDPDAAEESDDYGLILMRVERQPDGEDELVTLDSEEEAEAVYNVFMESAFSDEEDE